jgi:uroporphyrinogen decarboxylase
MTNLLFRNALNRIPQATPPIWFMRQAGRYHSHYQALKKNYTFEELCKNPKLAAETALGPINDFDFDVSILFSDILFPLEALGMGLKYDPGPIFSKFITPNNIKELISVDDAIKK